MARRKPLVRSAGKLTQLLAADVLAIPGAMDYAGSVAASSAATLNIGALAANTIRVSVGAVATITSFGTAVSGPRRTLIFGGAITLTHNATSLILPGATNIVTAAGDVATFESVAAGNWRCTGYERSNGQALVPSVTGAALAVGDLVPWDLSEGTIPAGRIPRYGQEVDRATWPELWAKVSPSAIDDSVWLAAPYLSRSKYSKGNGTTTFRMPDTNAKHPDGNTPAAAVLRGNGKNSAGEVGMFQLDQSQGFIFGDPRQGSFAYFSALNQRISATANAGTSNVVLTTVDQDTTTAAQYAKLRPITNGTDGEPRTGSETRGTNATVIWCTVGASVASNPGTVDVVALASTVATQASKIQTLETQGSLGVGQTPRNMAPSVRALNTVYTNSNPYTIFPHINIVGSIAGGRATLTLTKGSDTAVIIGSGIGTSGGGTSVGFPVPPGWSYSGTLSTGVANSFTWVELTV